MDKSLDQGPLPREGRSVVTDDDDFEPKTLEEQIQHAIWVKAGIPFHLVARAVEAVLSVPAVSELSRALASRVPE